MSRRFNLAGVLLATLSWGLSASAGGPWLANGMKSGEATTTTIRIWTRLTDRPDMSSEGTPWPMIEPKREGNNWTFPGPQIPEGKSIVDMAYVVPGVPGEVRISYWPEATSNMSSTTDWAPVAAESDFTHHFLLEKLQPGTHYQCVVEARATGGSEPTARVQGTFQTVPAPSDSGPVSFTVVTGQEFWRRDDDVNGHKIYPLMQKLRPSFFVHTGDIVYYDNDGPWVADAAQARFKWNQMYALPFQRAFHNAVSSYFIRDDHDTWQNDCWPTMQNNKMGAFTYAQGVDIFFEQVPAPDRSQPYRTIRWGKDLQIWLPEGREFRSPNTDPDGPGKTIWGAEQKAWFKKTVQESDAAFRVLISPTPLVGPDRGNKADNHANATFSHEGSELREFMAAQENMVVVCGDRHWQYVSIDPDTGLREFCSGPTSNAHAGGFSEDQREPMHQYLAVIGGFLWGNVQRIGGVPTLTFRHYDVEGKVVYEQALTPDTALAPKPSTAK